MSNAFIITEVAGGNDLFRGWITNTADVLPSPGYFNIIRTHVSGGPRGWEAWLMYIVNFTETGTFLLG